MQLIIDGHNLIPHVQGIRLSDIDDEAQLTDRLVNYCRVKRCKVFVFFDQAPVGFSGVRSYGAVTAHFVPQGQTADDAIIRYLKQLKGTAKNYRVVSSDRMVMAAARDVHAQVITSVDFAKEMVDTSEEAPDIDPRSRLLSDEEISDWEALFQDGKKSKITDKSDKNKKR